ncbi:hypothetical protein ACLVWU_10410 [Bdellovibrio sp. HCB290]|uniref:hypothetical protein n=1 Tax=Bdellovibrio sp. HCB290 TaxID=3394356 RepID=UPI0039B43826
MFGSSNFTVNQNHLGKYVCLSVWAVSLTFCFYYLAMDVPLIKLAGLALIAIIGVVTTTYFTPEKNQQAVIIQTLLMYASLGVLMTIPAIINHAIAMLLIVALNPVIFLNRMRVELIFGNLIISILTLIIYQMTKPLSSVPILEQLLEFFMKFMMIVFVFVQVYGLRLLYDRSQPQDPN